MSIDHLDEKHVEAGRRDGSNMGRAVHSVLQSIDLFSGENLESLAHAQATVEHIPKMAVEISNLVQTALKSDIVRRAITSGKYYREVYVNTKIENIDIEGFIDLIFEENGELVVVDYKTDSIGQKPPTDRLNKYELQLGMYALALSEVTNKPIRELTVLFLKTGYEHKTPCVPELLNRSKNHIGNGFAL